MRTLSKFKHIVILALSDLKHEWLLNTCFVIALSAIITPVLILLGLKTGVFETWKQRVLQSPIALEVVFKEHTNLPQLWFDKIKQYEETGFVVPTLFSASATMTLKGASNSLFVSGVDVIPTDSGDPLTGKKAVVPKSPYEIVLTQGIARKLHAKVNDSVNAVISRKYKGEKQYVTNPMRVVYIVPDTVFSREAAFVSVSFVTALESYKDGRQVLAFNVTNGYTDEPVFPPYPRARLYASNLENVLPLSKIVSKSYNGSRVMPRKAEVIRLQNMQTMITNIFNLIIVMAFLGILLSLSASLWANIDRKRKQLALLQLLGLRKFDMLFFPIIQACAISVFAMLTSYIFYLINSYWISALFSGQLFGNELATQLLLKDYLFLSLVLIIVAFTSALLGGYHASKIEPAEAIREV